MATADTTYDRINDYASVKISLARPHDIRSWSMGEVKKPETINYRTYRPEKDGLFCERIFGPEKDWECACGKYRGMKYKGMICDRCGVKVTHSRVRRKRMGHIELAAPVVHIWFFKAMPSRLGNLLNMKTSSLEKVIYFQDYVVTNAGTSDLERQQLLSEEEFRAARAEFGEGSFEAKMGADAIRELLGELDLVQLSDDLRVELAETGSKQKRKDLTNRLKIVEAIRDSDNKPEWMVLDVIPVIPPDLRPLVLLDSGNFATSDLNDLYRRIINRNNRLRKLVDLNAPEVIIRNEKRMLQQSVDALFDNNRCKRPVLGSSNRPLKSLTDMIKGKQGRFRENLLGKRVDYSARSVIVVGARLKLHQCGLPKKIALELFQPFIIRKLKELGHADTIKSAKKMLERKDEEVWDILEQVIKNHPVMLNRAPTLHRMGIQAFEPILVEGNAIHLHPLVCKGFNADFDGDQMAVHLPLSIEAQVEAHTLMLSTNNIFAPSNGRPIMSPSQDTVMGCYYISLMLPNQKGDGMTFASLDEADHAFAQGVIKLHAKIKVRIKEGRFIRNGDEEKRLPSQIIETSYGRIMLNMMLPEGMDFYNYPLKSGDLATVISDCYQALGRRATIELLDDMNQLGFRESTRSGLSFATDDLVTPEDKEKIIAEADKEVIKLRKHYERGVITEKERYNKVLETWTHAREAVTAVMMQAMKEDDRGGMGYVNPVYLMAHSGARGGVEQIRQLAGMRGLMAKPTGEIIETPIKANFREGLSVLEYFSSTHGARKGLADTALKTADSGYLTRKLADVAQNVVVTMEDCGTTQGITKGIIYRGEQVEVRLATAINGRVSRQNIVNAVTDEIIVRESQMITPEIAKKIEDMGLEKIQVRSPMTCDAPLGVCRKCYGMDMSTGDMVEEGMAVGIIAAQSIGEPGTQLTMRTFHIGGVANTSTEKNEERCKKAGFIKLIRMRHVTNGDGDIVVLNRNAEIAILDKRGRELESHKIPAGATLLVKEGDEVKAKAVLCRWNPFAAPILSEVTGKVRFEDILEGETMVMEREASGTIRRTIIDFKGDLHPQIVVEDKDGTVLDVYYLPERANITVTDGQKITPGTAVAETPREASGISDITGGLPRVTEIFEARKPKDPAVLAEIDGTIELGDKKRGKRTIIVKNESGLEVEHLVPPGKRFLVHSGDFVHAGQQLIDGPLVPHDILRVSGEEAVQQYLGHEIQQVYRSQRVEINDKHVEIIVARMLRKVKIESAGDSNMLPGLICDRFELLKVNEELAKCVKVTHKGDSDYTKGQVVPRDVLEETNAKIETLGGEVAKITKPRMATYSTQLLGITKASVQSSSFISAASFQETTKVLTEAALAGKVDNLVGLKENVILGHLIPAGTGFRTFQESEVQYNLEAMRLAAEQPTQTLEDSFPLLESATATNTVPDDGGSADVPSDFLSAMANSGTLGAELSGGAGAPGGEAGIGANVSMLADTSTAGDDFTKIEGVGPKIAELLSAGGIESFAQLSQTPPDHIKSVLNAGGPTFANHDPSTWPDQALLAANGEWSQLKEWQDQLVGGKMVGDMQTPAGVETLMAADDSAALTATPVADTPPSGNDDLPPAADDGLDSLIMGGSDDAVPVAPAEPEAVQPEPTQPEAVQPETATEDLTKIEGVGPKIAELLNAGGINSFAQLASTPPDQVKSILTAGGGSFAAHDPTTWPQQSQMAADGKWDELKAWQDVLDGGKPAAEPDDLTKVEGIGPKIGEILAAAGLTTFAVLASTSADKVKEILEAAEGNFAAHDPTTWPQQAQMAANGQWEALQKWQDELDGGRA